MERLQLITTVFTAIAGALVLGSYWIGIQRAQTPAALWGGIPPSAQRYIVPFMLLAAAGFLAFFVLLVFVNDASVFNGLRWPWGTSDGQGGIRMLIALGVFLIPSIFWLGATRMHLASGSGATQALTIGILVVVGIGTAMLVLLGYSAWQDGAKGGVWIFLGAIAIAIQCIINDAIIWVIMFPWRG